MKKWEILNQFKVESSKFKVEELINILLENRGVVTKKEKEEFLHPDLANVTIESVGIDEKEVQKAIKRIATAKEKKEQIIVYGDYDVDGITSSAIVWETLHELKIQCMPYIPSRMDEGYGLSKIGISNVQSQFQNVKVIITVDNGIVAHEAVEYANSQGIDVIITDHHVAESEHFPAAYALVHTTALCGAGIAYLFSKRINKEFGITPENERHLELAALGTVADLVPLKGANRSIVHAGLSALKTTKRLGLLALFEEAVIDPLSIGVYQIGHIIAPRLNATGRIEHAIESLRLLCTIDKNRATELAIQLGITNRERQMIMREATEDALRVIRDQGSGIRNILILSDEKYQEGVIGLVAGKLVEEFYRPAIVISIKDKHSKGSVRSVAGFNIIEFLREHGKDHFINVGGHPMAAGFTIETSKIEAFKKMLEDKAELLVTEDHLQRIVKIDCQLPFSAITSELYTAIQALSPFGMGNFEPVFQTDDVTIADMKVIGKEATHLRLYLESEGKKFEAIAFNLAEKSKEYSVGDTISVVYTIDTNTWNGNTKLQLKVKDIRLSR